MVCGLAATAADAARVPTAGDAARSGRTRSGRPSPTTPRVGRIGTGHLPGRSRADPVDLGRRPRPGGLDAQVWSSAPTKRGGDHPPGRRVATAGSLGRSRGGDLTRRCSTGAPTPLGRPSWTQVAAGRRAGLSRPASACRPRRAACFRARDRRHQSAGSGVGRTVPHHQALPIWSRSARQRVDRARCGALPRPVGPGRSARVRGRVCALGHTVGFVILARPSPASSGRHDGRPLALVALYRAVAVGHSGPAARSFWAF
jgi:hypothetical protein